MWKTFQDRLKSELRLAVASTLEQANQVLEKFLGDYNRRFAVPAQEAAGDFRPLSQKLNWDRLFSLKYERVVGKDHVIPFGARSIQLPPQGRQVRLCRLASGTLASAQWRAGGLARRRTAPPDGAAVGRHARPGTAPPSRSSRGFTPMPDGRRWRCVRESPAARQPAGGCTRGAAAPLVGGAGSTMDDSAVGWRAACPPAWGEPAPPRLSPGGGNGKGGEQIPCCRRPFFAEQRGWQG